MTSKKTKSNLLAIYAITKFKYFTSQYLYNSQLSQPSYIKFYITNKLLSLSLITLIFIILLKELLFISYINYKNFLQIEALSITKNFYFIPNSNKPSFILNHKHKKKHYGNELSYAKIPFSYYISKFILNFNNYAFHAKSLKAYTISSVRSIRYTKHNKTHQNLKKYSNQLIPWLWPTLSKKISSNFGYRIHPVYKVMSFHNGIDIKAKIGCPILAPTNGYIHSIFNSKTLGKVIKFKTECGHIIYFAHLQKILCTRNSKVKRGTIIATVGNTGITTGPHLHISVIKDNHFVNPLKFFQK